MTRPPAIANTFCDLQRDEHRPISLDKRTKTQMPIFALAVFLSSFLLFTVQPMMAKFLLPAFGGTASVWATCLTFFQTLLLAGYAYAHLLRMRLSPAAQRWTHFFVLAGSFLFLPPMPVVSAGANTVGTPLYELIRCLFSSVGLPFFALSATAPLLMEWFRHSAPGRSPDRLYAFSNAGSLLALICYPFLVEPAFTRGTQARLWSGGMGLFLVVCAITAWRSRHRGTAPESKPIRTSRKIPPQRALLPAWLWVASPACGSALLMALTNQISQDVAPMPLLWIAPMSVYLLTFILCFEGGRIYQRKLFIPAGFLSFLWLAWLLDEGYLHGFWFQIGGYLGVLFCGCMICHGELYRLRPQAERLTAYYLAISLGGAVGGAFVALGAPLLFKALVETPLIATAIATLSTFILWREKSTRARGLPAVPLALVGTIATAASLGFVLQKQWKESVYLTRSFYGVYHVTEGPRLLLNKDYFPLVHGTARVLLSGQIYHGLQFIDPAAARIPTAYYGETSGLALAFRELSSITNLNIGAIGLGTGTLTAYGRTGDRMTIYELNPDVLRVAQTYFTFLTNCQAQVSVVLGDGRISLERQADQHFDLLVVDAFSGDSIPLHLLTDEAMSTYLRHLKPGGVLAFHISNSHLDLEPVVRALAEEHELTSILVPPRFLDPRSGQLASIWMLISKGSFLNRPAIADLAKSSSQLGQRKPRLWTDDYSSILPILH